MLGLGLLPVGLAASALMAFFTAIVTRDVLQNKRTTCSCFGRFSNENVSELTVVRDLFLVVLAGLIVIAPNRFLALDALFVATPAGPPLVDAIPVVLLAVPRSLLSSWEAGWSPPSAASSARFNCPRCHYLN